MARHFLATLLLVLSAVPSASAAETSRDDEARRRSEIFVGRWWPESAERGAVRVLLQRRPAVPRHLALADLAHRDGRHAPPQICPSLVVKSLISASSTPTITPSPIEAALPVICACVWIVPPPSVHVKVTSALAWP